MKGNERLGLTAEMAALIRAEKKSDKYSHYFVTPRARRIYSVVGWVFPKTTIQRIFDKRTKLSNEVHKLVEQYKPEQIIELASGSSAFGLEYSQRHPQVVYIETDMDEVIKKKKSILEQILQAENLSANPNHVLVSVDVLSDDIYKALQKHLKKGKRTIVIAEGLTSYFDEEQYKTFMDNVSRFLDRVGECSYLSHEALGEKMTSGTGGKILRSLVSVVTRSKSHQHFHSKEELGVYFNKRGFRETKHIDSSSGSYVYLMKK
jgi:O-methyltransferase involved in polyketide biosynthesis